MINISTSNFIIALPEIYLAMIGFIILVVGLFKKNLDTTSRVVFFDKLFVLTLITIFLCLLLVLTIGDTYVETFHSLFVISPSIFLFKVIIIVFTLLIMIVSRKYIIDKGIYQYEYLSIVLFFLLGNLLLISSNDFISFYVSLEVTTICLYILFFINKQEHISTQVGIKYFILGALGTGFLLYGISMVYGYTGLTNFMAIKVALKGVSENWILLIGMVMIIVGIGFKLSLVPFHMWTPDVYMGVNKFMLLLLAVVSKFSVLFIFIRILWEPFYEVKQEWTHIVMILVFASAIVGFIAAVYQHNLKTFVAYSSIANMAYMLSVIIIPSEQSLRYIVIYQLAYGVALVGFIGSLMLIKKENSSIKEIYDLKGLSKGKPYLAFALSVFLISMAGLPITAGFFGKILVLLVLFDNDFYIMGITIALLSVVMIYFYLKVIKIMYFDTYQDSNVKYATIKETPMITFVLFMLFVFSIAFLVFLNSLISILENFVFFL